MPTIKDQAICLRLKDWSETSQIAVLLTEAHGKISVLAKGAKRQTPSATAKFSGGIELLTAGEGVFIVKANTDLANLIEWNLQEPYWHLRNHLGAYQRAIYGIDLLYHLIGDHDPHAQSYLALYTLLGGLVEPSVHEETLLQFQWRVVNDMGFAPVLSHDAQTGQAIDMSQITFGFHPLEGGLVADTGRGDRWRVRRETILLLQSIANGDDISQQDEVSLNRANRLLCAYFRSILSKSLPTMDFILNGA